MIQDEIKQMIQKTSKDKIALHKLSTKGYISYLKNTQYKGAIATINSQRKAVISYLQDINDETHVIATVRFENGCTLIYGLCGEEYYLRQTGNLLNMNGFRTSRVYTPNKEGIISDIKSIRSHCLEKFEQTSPLFKKLSKQDRIPKDTIIKLLNETLTQLNNTKDIKEPKKEVSPKVETTQIKFDKYSASQYSTHDKTLDKTPEI